ncbi:asparaginase [Nocardioides limicola]|uniref:asparaginase n=1 Tax=Nocardioides limicola TaxID=2803368 RepID=UPI0035588548
MSHELVAEVVRSGLVESVHHGSVVALDQSGAVVLAVGAVDLAMFPRSANKPMQAAAMVGLGLDLETELLALVAASHSGEPFHRDGTRRILATVGLDETALQNTPGYPLDPVEERHYCREGHAAAAVTADCSGKHAGMLATCRINGWSTTDYLRPDHPLQQQIAATLERLAGEPITHTGVDGCGAPVASLTLTGLARAFRTMSLGEPDSPERRVAIAVQQHPEWASGTRRDELLLVRGVPGLFAKAGAEGVFAAGLDDGRSVAIKIADGQSRPRPVVMAAALRMLGLAHPVLDELGSAPVLGGGQPVGELRAATSGWGHVHQGDRLGTAPRDPESPLGE